MPWLKRLLDWISSSKAVPWRDAPPVLVHGLSEQPEDHDAVSKEELTTSINILAGKEALFGITGTVGNIETYDDRKVTMELEVLRFSSQKDSTLGIFSNTTSKKFLCFTLEDEFRTVKVYGETRIPVGRYQLRLKTDGSFHEKYLAKFGPEIHKGMIEVYNVPNFTAILHHIGNTDDDTAGCTLYGNTAQQNITEEGSIGGSTEAYKRVYPIIRDLILQGEVWITYKDYDKP